MPSLVYMADLIQIKPLGGGCFAGSVYSLDEENLMIALLAANGSPDRVAE